MDFNVAFETVFIIIIIFSYKGSEKTELFIKREIEVILKLLTFYKRNVMNYVVVIFH